MSCHSVVTLTILFIDLGEIPYGYTTGRGAVIYVGLAPTKNPGVFLRSAIPQSHQLLPLRYRRGDNTSKGTLEH